MSVFSNLFLLLEFYKEKKKKALGWMIKHSKLENNESLTRNSISSYAY